MNSSAQAHGLSYEVAAPDWPHLELDELASLLRSYPLAGQPTEIIWHSPRPFSSAALVQTNRGPLFVKRHHETLRSSSDLAEEHAFIQHLYARAVPVARLLCTENGATATVLGDWTCEVQYPAQGVDLYRDALSWTPFHHPHHAYAAGVALAKLHVAASDYQAPSRRSRLLVANYRLFGQAFPLHALQDELAQRPALAAWLSERSWQEDIQTRVLAPFHAKAYPLLREEPSLWTHGDWHASNLLWSDAEGTPEISAVLDFGLCDASFALFDLASTIERNLIPWLELDQGRPAVAELDQLDALLNGYASILPLNSERLRYLAALLPLVHADFALSEIEYFAGVTHSAENATLAYERYLLGHADWFLNSEGQRLMKHLDRLARRAL